MEIPDKKRRKNRRHINWTTHLFTKIEVSWARAYLDDGIFWKSQCSGSTMVQAPNCYAPWRF